MRESKSTLTASDKRRQLIENILDKHGINVSSRRIPLKPRPESNTVRAAYSQQQIWFVHQLDPQSSAYNIPLAFRVKGSIRADQLKQSLAIIVERHESLRTSFCMMGGRVMQVISDPAGFNMPFVNLQVDIEAIGEDEIRGIALHEAKLPFNLDDGPLIRFTLIELNDCDHVLLITVHHIVFDGLSVGILMRELQVIYDALVTSVPIPLPQPHLQYGDYAQWQQDQELDKDLTYWQGKLSGSLPVIDLPNDYPRPSTSTHRGGYVTMRLEKDTVSAIVALTKAEATTVFTVLLASFHVMLSRYTGSDDVLTGTTISGRDCSDVEDTIGCFVGLLVVRTNLEHNATFREYVRHVHEVVVEAYDHQSAPFDQIVKALGAGRDVNRAPIVQVVFEDSNIGIPALILRDLEIDAIRQEESTTVKFDLKVSVWHNINDIGATFEYNSDLFNESTVKRMAGHFQTLVTNAIRHLDIHVSSLAIMDDAELKQILVEWNSTDHEYPKDKCIHELIEEQVSRTPDKCAVRCGKQVLTYSELSRRSNQLAHVLCRQGVGPEDLVGVDLERSLELIVCLLAVLKTGAAYVPLDPTYPSERSRAMAQGADLRTVLTSHRNASAFDGLEVQVLIVDEQWFRYCEIPTTDTMVSTSVDNRIYSIYTSGSSGEPKAAQVLHSSFTNLVSWYIREFGFSSADKFLVISSPAFDLTQKNLFAPLVVGGQVVLYDSHIYDPLEITDLIEREQITVINCTPSAAYPIIAACGLLFKKMVSVKHLLLGGEPISTDNLMPWVESPDFHTEIVNTYGPTECSDVATFHRINYHEYMSGQSPSIGRPISNVSAYILGSNLRPVPIGAIGELYLAGLGVGAGYYRDLGLTSQKFVNMDIGTAHAKRMYKTGDLARNLPDGSIQWLGRSDDQVKIRGHRIDTGEIEQTLQRHMEIQRCVVVTSKSDKSPTIKHLIAYVVLSTSSSLCSNDIREYSRSVFPEHEVPSYFVVLDTFPVTSNGKLDRRALQHLDIENHRIEPMSDLPLTDTEATLAEIWANVLGFDLVGVNDNFFELGGDSLQVVQIAARAKEKGLHVSPRDIFTSPTIARLAKTCVVCASNDVELVAGVVPLTPIQHRFFERFVVDPHHKNGNILLSVSPKIDIDSLDRAFAKVLEHHDALRISIVREGNNYSQLITSATDAPIIARFDLSEYSGVERMRRLAEIGTSMQNSFRFTGEPLLKVAYLNYGPDAPGRLIVIAHHLIIDTFSFGILLNDLKTAYHQAEADESLHLPPRTSSFRDWSESMAKGALAQSADQELCYWNSLPWHLVKPLPVELTGAKSVAMERVKLYLGPSNTELLRRLVSLSGGNLSPMHFVLSAVHRTLCGWTGQRATLVETFTHARRSFLSDNLDLSRTIGWLVAHFPVLLSRTPECSDFDQVSGIASQFSLIPNSGLGYGVLRYLANGNMAKAILDLPQPEIMFSFVNGSTRNSVLEDQDPTFLSVSDEFYGERCSRKHDEINYKMRIHAELTRSDLFIRWSYRTDLFSEATVAELASECIRLLTATCV